jgi:putative aldouronate transport system substrate-binding protein
MKVKKLLAAVVIGTLSMTLFTACNKDKPSNTDNGVISWSYFTDYPMPEGAEVKKKIEEKFNVKINVIQFTGDNYMAALNLKLASNDAPDVFKVNTYDNLKKYAQQGVIAEVPLDTIKQYAPNLWAYVEKNDKDAPIFTNVDGKNYGFPTVWPLGPNCRTMAIRTDWLENLGLEIPTTLEELEKVLYAFRNDDPDKNGQKDTYGMSSYDYGASLNFSPIFGAFNAYPENFMVDKDGKLQYGSIVPEAKEALQLLNKWYKDEIIDPSWFVDKSDVFVQKWVSGKFGVIPDTFWWSSGPAEKYFSGRWHDPVIQANSKAKIETIAPPKGPNGYQGMAQRTAANTVEVIAFSKKLEKKPEVLKKFLQVQDTLQSDPYWAVLIYDGEEGVTFKRNPNGGVTYIAPYDKKEKRDEYGANGCFSMAPNYDIYDTATKDINWIRKEQAKAIGKVDAIKNYPLEGWVKNRVRLKEIESKAYANFITGKRPLSEYDKFVEEWLSAGGKEVIEEARQVYEKHFKK